MHDDDRWPAPGVLDRDGDRRPGLLGLPDRDWLARVMTDQQREQLIEAWRTVLHLETDRKAQTAARWALRGLDAMPPVQADSQSAAPERAGRIP